MPSPTLSNHATSSKMKRYRLPNVRLRDRLKRVKRPTRLRRRRLWRFIRMCLGIMIDMMSMMRLVGLMRMISFKVCVVVVGQK
jgi:hypothetical protein